jgi:WW domain-binding protein 4
VPSIQPEVPERKFKEKVITHIPADETSSLTINTFIKKRKLPGNRNTRQRLDVD